MNSRHIIATTGALLLWPGRSLAAERVFYEPGLAESAIKDGNVVFLDFWTKWCSTCAAQERVISRLRSTNPRYDAAITFITVDWDRYSDSQFARDLAIPRRSTLVAMKGKTEIGRIVAGTSEEQIRNLLDSALSAATS